MLCPELRHSSHPQAPPSPDLPSPKTAQNFARLFFSRRNFRSFLPSLGGLLVEFWWCLKRRDPRMCTFRVFGLSCEPSHPSGSHPSEPLLSIFLGSGGALPQSPTPFGARADPDRPDPPKKTLAKLGDGQTSFGKHTSFFSTVNRN